MTKLTKDLKLKICRINNADGLFDTLDNSEIYIIKINQKLSFLRKISVLFHEIIHYLAEKKYIQGDDEKIARLVEKITEKALKEIKREL